MDSKFLKFSRFWTGPRLLFFLVLVGSGPRTRTELLGPGTTGFALGSLPYRL